MIRKQYRMGRASYIERQLPSSWWSSHLFGQSASKIQPLFPLPNLRRLERKTRDSLQDRQFTRCEAWGAPFLTHPATTFNTSPICRFSISAMIRPVGCKPPSRFASAPTMLIKQSMRSVLNRSFTVCAIPSPLEPASESYWKRANDEFSWRYSSLGRESSPSPRIKALFLRSFWHIAVPVREAALVTTATTQQLSINTERDAAYLLVPFPVKSSVFSL